jgi:hypothetical protein
MAGEGPFTFDLHNRGDRHPASSGSRRRFKTLVIPAHAAWCVAAPGWRRPLPFR